MIASSRRRRAPVSALVLGLTLITGCPDETSTPDAAAPDGATSPSDGRIALDKSPLAADTAPAADATAPRFRWITYDAHTHTHGRGCSAQVLTPSQLRALMVAQGVDAASVLVWSDGLKQTAQQGRVTGRDDPASTSTRLLRFGIELSAVPVGDFGHVLLPEVAGTDSWAHLAQLTTQSNVPVVQWASARRRLIGVAHGEQWPGGRLHTDGRFLKPNGSCCVKTGDNLVKEAPVHAILGQLHFIESNGFGNVRAVDGHGGMMELWSKLLNVGARLAIVGGSDYLCRGATPGAVGSPRTLVRVEEPPSFEGIFRAIRAGRTAVINKRNARIDVRVAAVGIGGEGVATAGRALDVVVDATTARTSDAIELIVNGARVKTTPIKTGISTTRLSVTLTRSSWIVARTFHAVASPVYLLVDNKPIRASSVDACYLVRYVRALHAGTKDTTLRAHYTKARLALEQRFRDAGGTACL